MVRFMIVALLLGSLFLGWNAWRNQKKLEDYKVALQRNGEISSLVEEIQTNAHLYTAYKERSLSEGVQGDDPQHYIIEIAAKERVSMGRVDVTPDTPRGNIRGFIDRGYTIRPPDRSTTYRRGNIANFLYSLEANSRRIHVTRVNLNAPGRIPDHELPPDQWTMDVTVMMRDREEPR